MNAGTVANNDRWRLLRVLYDPILGIGSPCPRTDVALNDNMFVRVPIDMAQTNAVKYIVSEGTLARAAARLHQNVGEALAHFSRTRCTYDFEFWSATCVSIQTKSAGIRKFVLNKPQRKLLDVLEQMRISGVPKRVILLKARQWAGRRWCNSTLRGYNSFTRRVGTR